MKAKIFNFEILHVDELVRRQRIEDMLLQAKIEGIDTVFGLLLMDGFLYRNPEEFSTDLNIKLVAGMCADRKHLFFDYTHRIVYNSYNSSEYPKWNHNAEKFLMLGGIPSRKNRINLLEMFYNLGLLESAVWSFFPPWTQEDQQWCRQSLSHLSDSEYTRFIDQCNAQVDAKYNESKNYSKMTRNQWKQEDIYNKPWIKDAGWIDPNIFSNTALSVISEGNAYPPATNYKFLTEKTWRTIAMRHPFVFAGYPEQFEYMKTLGLKTFENYMTIKDYAYLGDEDQRLSAVVKNTKDFLTNKNKFIVELQADIEHNYQVFLDISKQQEQFFDMLRSHGVEEDQISYWFDQKGFAHLLKD